MANARINSTVSFTNTDAETGDVFMDITITWGGVAPMFVNLLGDALINTIIDTTMKARQAAEQVKAASPAA